MITYKSSGVDIGEADRLVDFLKERIPGIGFFSGLFPLNLKGYQDPVLVASTDGVGTKLMVANLMKNHKTIGIDLVAMIVNDICVCGAKPLFFLDYFATGKLDQRQAREILSGIIKGCEIAASPLLGGETAELPGLYQKGDYDLAGFGVGIVDRNKIIDGSAIFPGDVFIGVASSGLHSNGYSLARKALLEKAGLSLNRKPAGWKQKLGDALLKPTLIYSNLTSALLKRIPIKGIAHITGGGIPGNLNRILPKNIDAAIDIDLLLPFPKIFEIIRTLGPVSWGEMFKTFNMGVGLILACDPALEKKTHQCIRSLGFESKTIGKAVKGHALVQLNHPK